MHVKYAVRIFQMAYVSIIMMKIINMHIALAACIDLLTRHATIWLHSTE